MIKENRVLKNYTQEELAEMLGISVRQMQRIEKDEDKTKISTLKSIINILQIPDSEIVKFMKSKKD